MMAMIINCFDNVNAESSSEFHSNWQKGTKNGIKSIHESVKLWTMINLIHNDKPFRCMALKNF